jgi:hypothetical protein
MSVIDLVHPDEVFDVAGEHMADEQPGILDEPIDLTAEAVREFKARAPKPTVLRAIRGMGKIYDWRGTGLLAPSGGRITPVIFVQHIPVYPNKPGYRDFLALAAILNEKGLSIQCATDSEGNVALYNPFDALCYQARGANQVSCGCEHMHYSVDEPWTKKQLRAAGWLAQLAKRKHGIPYGMAKLGSGHGVVRVLRHGHTSHKCVSDCAGFFDRIDPGPGYDWAYVRHCAKFYTDHGHMQGA